MKQQTFKKLLILGLLFVFLFSACRERTSEIAEVIPTTITPTHTTTWTPSPSSTFTPTATVTPTPEPSATPTITPTETMQWDERGLSLTPIPIFNELITQDNVNRVDALAVWGNGKANTIALSPDGSILAVGTGIGTYLYESFNFRIISTLSTPFSVESIAFSPGNLLIAMGQSQGTIDIYELRGESLVVRLSIPGVPFNNPHQVTVRFSPNGAHLASIIETDNTLYINRWRTDSWQQISAFAIPSGLVSYLNPSADLVGIVSGNQLLLQSLSFAEESRSITLPTSLARAFWERIPQQNGEIMASAAGDFILVNNGSNIVHWKLLDEAITYRLDQYPEQLPDPCYEAPNSCRNTRGSFSWVCAESTIIPPIETILLTPDNAAFLVSLNNNLTEFRRSVDGRKIWEIDTLFTQAAFSPNSEFFFGLKPNGTIEKRTISDGSLVFALHQHPSQLTGLSFSPDASLLAAGFTDGWIRVYSSFNGEMLGVLDGSATALQFSSDGRLLAAGLQDGTVRVFLLEEGLFFDLPGGHFDRVTGIAFTSNDETLLTGSHDCTISEWDLGGRFRRKNLTPGGANPFQITMLEHAFTDGSQFLLAKGNGIFQVKDSESTVFFAPRNLIFSSMTLSPNSRHLAATGTSTWLIPDLALNPQRSPQELPASMDDTGHRLAFTPNNALLIVAYIDGLDFWSVAEAERLAYLPFSPHIQGTNPPVDLAVSPDGSLIALGKQDGLIYVFFVLEDTP